MHLEAGLNKNGTETEIMRKNINVEFRNGDRLANKDK